MTTRQVTESPAPAPVPLPVPMGTLLKNASADPKTTNALLLILVLCMSGLMPEQLQSLCGL